jgi:hypothetical protein
MSATAERINPYRMFTGSWIPTWLLERRELSPGAKLVYARLARFAGKKGVAYPRQATLAAKVGLPMRTLQRYVFELREFRLIFVRQGGGKGQGRPARYFFLNHVWITGAGFLATPRVAEPKALAMSKLAEPKRPPLNERARGLEESHTEKRVTAARGAAAPQHPVSRNFDRHTVSRSTRVRLIVGGIASKLTMPR